MRQVHVSLYRAASDTMPATITVPNGYNGDLAVLDASKVLERFPKEGPLKSVKLGVLGKPGIISWVLLDTISADNPESLFPVAGA